MRARSLLIVSLVAAAAAAPALLYPSRALGADTCTSCHADATPEISASFEKDIHKQKGLSCWDCHGGDKAAEDMNAAMSKEKGFVGKVPKIEIGKFCDRCHGDIEFMRNYNPQMRVDQFRQYLTSVHGKLNQQGDLKPATCVDCHGVHGVLSPSDPLAPVYPKNVPKTCGKCHSDKALMAGYGIPTDQMEEYQGSVHADMIYKKEDLSAPTCNDCHGNHGAVPPGFRSVVEVCGNCHAVQEEKFKAGKHDEIFAENGIPGCVTCHSNHFVKVFDDSFIIEMEKSVCAQCHNKGDKGWEENLKIARKLVDFRSRVLKVNGLLESADRKSIDVSSARFIMTKDVNDVLIKTRVAIHTMSLVEIKPLIDAGVVAAAKAQEKAVKGIKDRQIRKTGLAVSIFFILLFAASMYLYLRSREKGKL